MLSFKEKVLRVVACIPKGKVMSYKEVAERARAPRAWRAVGNILNKNYEPEIPCHRVICSDGRVGDYNRGAEKKKQLLKKEGISLVPGRSLAPLAKPLAKFRPVFSDGLFTSPKIEN